MVIPATIDGLEVTGIMPNAFNAIRQSGIKKIIVPCTLKFIGSKDTNLYEDFCDKKAYARPKIYFSKKKYDECVLIKNVIDERCPLIEVLENDLASTDFLLLNKYQDKNDYWIFPENGMWIYKETLECYLGDADVLAIEGCQRIAEGAFENVDLIEIEFGEQVKVFESGMIRNCKKLRKLVFKSQTRCSFAQDAISYCDVLEEVYWPRTTNFELVSIYNNCPKLGDMVIYNRMMTCQTNDEVIVLDNGLERVNNGAFASCKNARILYVPAEVMRLEDDALNGSNIEIVIFEGRYTQWKAHPHNEKYLYIYTSEGSNVMNSVSPNNSSEYVCMKNLQKIEEFISDNVDMYKLKEICYKNMDDTSDEEMILKPYRWDKEIWRKG